jgi:UDP-N-acetylglucosamine 3-dehydrogenase
MGEIHLKAYMRNPLVEVVGVCDLSEERADAICKRYGVRAYRSTTELLCRAPVEAVSICTSDSQHVDPTLSALDASVHVLLEKPIATTLEDADSILRRAASSRCKLMMGHILRFDPQYAGIKRAVDQGRLGRLISLFCRRMNSVEAQEVLQGRVSVLSFLGVHDFDYMRWLAGSEVVCVHTEARSDLLASKGYPVEDNTFTLLRFANGVIGCAEIGWALPASFPRKADFKLEVLGTGGVAHYDLLGQGYTVCTEEDGYERPKSGGSIDTEISEFIACILEDRAPSVGGEEGRAALEISIAAGRSVETGKLVSLPL